MARTTPKATRAEVGLLVGIVIVAGIALSPLVKDYTIAGVGLIAWMLWFTMIAAPLVGLIISLRSKED